MQSEERNKIGQYFINRVGNWKEKKVSLVLYLLYGYNKLRREITIAKIEKVFSLYRIRKFL